MEFVHGSGSVATASDQSSRTTTLAQMTGYLLWLLSSMPSLSISTILKWVPAGIARLTLEFTFFPGSPSSRRYFAVKVERHWFCSFLTRSASGMAIGDAKRTDREPLSVASQADLSPF